jgi:DNA-binding transcriptional ArsR family regulator
VKSAVLKVKTRTLKTPQGAALNGGDGSKDPHDRVALKTGLTRGRARHIVNRMVQYLADRNLAGGSSARGNVDSVLAAIADPTRRAILDRLARGPARISDVAEPFAMTLTGFCKHVKVLERAGLVQRTRRGRENTLRLSPKPLREVARWVLKYEQFWNERLDRLEEFFATQKEKSR